MDSARGFSGDIKAMDICLAMIVNLNTAVLIMKRRIDEHRLFGDVDFIADELAEHGRKVFLDVALASEHFDQRRIQPDAKATARSFDSVVSFQALSDKSRALHIPRLPGEDKELAVLVERLAACASNLL